MFILWLVAQLALVAGQQYPSKPNIVVIVADDMGYQDVGFRDSNIKTPNLDKLAREGVILENHYVTPACSPTRTSLMSGRHSIRTGFWRGNVKPTEEWGLRLNETTMAEMLKRNGYVTHGIGKWHCGMYTWDHTPVKRGFDTFFGLYLGAQKYFSHKRSGVLDFRSNYYDENGVFQDKLRRDLDGQYNTRLFSDEAVNLITNHDETNPLFLYLSYTAPHNPYDVSKKDVSNYAKGIGNKPNKVRPKYAAMISVMDEGIGKVVESLEEKGIMNNTVIVFLSDNGAVYGSAGAGSNYPLRGGKHSMFEGGIKTVSLVNSPLLNKSGYTNTNLLEVTDWYATFQRMAGDDPAQHGKPQLPLDGEDIWDTISNDTPLGREEVLVNLYLQSMIQSSRAYEFREKRDAETEEEEKEEDEEDGIESVADMNSGDNFALRWKNWKLLTGSFLSQGWIKQNQVEKDTIETDEYKDSSKEKKAKKYKDVTLLFNLEEDPRETNNVAEQNPDVVKIMMDKIAGYQEQMTPVNAWKTSKKGKKGGVWRPWVDRS